jgi:threonine synthase
LSIPSNAPLYDAHPCHVTHLECGLTGEVLDAGKLRNLSSAGKPLLVRYDLAAVGPRLTCGKT